MNGSNSHQQQTEDCQRRGAPVRMRLQLRRHAMSVSLRVGEVLR